jgi:probable addiction module antidote protein
MLNLNPRALFQLGNSTEGFHFGPDQLSRCAEDWRSRAQTYQSSRRKLATTLAKALGDIARAKGMSQVARDTGLSRESLYKALSGDRAPTFDTILKVTEALGLRLRAEIIATDSLAPSTLNEEGTAISV